MTNRLRFTLLKWFSIKIRLTLNHRVQFVFFLILPNIYSTAKIYITFSNGTQDCEGAIQGRKWRSKNTVDNSPLYFVGFEIMQTLINFSTFNQKISPHFRQSRHLSTRLENRERRSKSRSSRATQSPRSRRSEDNPRTTNTPDKMPVGSSKSGVLAQQIHDEFLTCKICLEGFSNPKSLDCLHTFCEDCIENHANSESSYKKYSDYREFTCPLCRKRTNLPLGGVKKLPDNFLVSSLTEVIDRQKPSKFQVCDFCKLVNRKHKEASAKCLDCSKLLCKSCVTQHQETKVRESHR